MWLRPEPYAILRAMKAKQPVEDIIHRRLRSLGLAGFGAVVLEAFAPLAMIGAQFAYILEPMVSGGGQRSWLGELAGLFERPEQLESFIDRLREESE